MSDHIRFDGRVAIVTGAGRGLGRTYAIELARRGAKVVVNDFGGARDGTGGSTETAQAVVAEIEALGGEAIADGASVTDAAGVAAMVEKAMAAWGRIDILIANAGILRDKSFAKMTLDDFAAVLDVHLNGTVICAKAVWDIMRAQNYGRIVLTTSSSGLYGNFGQANYGAAKMAIIGLMQTLKLEGERNDIRVNAISPAATTRLTEDLLPPHVAAKFEPEAVAPGGVYLASEQAPTGSILCAGAGTFAMTRLIESQGMYFPGTPTPEDVRDQWERIADRGIEGELRAGVEQSNKFLANAMD